MTVSRRVEPDAIAAMRQEYGAAMNCQIVHDSIHRRPGWTEEYLIEVDGVAAGYGSLAVAGPWREVPAIYEFYVRPAFRQRMFAMFEALLAATGARKMETQTNNPWLTVMLHSFAASVAIEAIVFADEVTTSLHVDGAALRASASVDKAATAEHGLDDSAAWVLTLDGAVVGAGDILYHYNRPYGDIYMAIAEPYRQRGLGALLVQELKRVCREGGSIPAARCNVGNLASRRTLQRAGLVPCGNIITGLIDG